MALFNYATKEITLKIVYYGPGLSGKTTNIQHLHSALSAVNKGKLLSLATESDRTLFFDFLPVELGKIKEFSVRFQLYTVPGQVRYNATRKVVLKGADAVVFVADSQRDMRDQNIESIENMRENLISNNLDPDEIPVVLQFNKRDLKNILTADELNSDLNPNGAFDVIEAEAIDGNGVEDTFRLITRLVLKEIARKHKIEIQPSPSKEEAKEELRMEVKEEVKEEAKEEEIGINPEPEALSLRLEPEDEVIEPTGYRFEEERAAQADVSGEEVGAVSSVGEIPKLPDLIAESPVQVEAERNEILDIWEAGGPSAPSIDSIPAVEEVSPEKASDLKTKYAAQRDVFLDEALGIGEVKETPAVSEDRLQIITADIGKLNAAIADLKAAVVSLTADLRDVRDSLRKAEEKSDVVEDKNIKEMRKEQKEMRSILRDIAVAISELKVKKSWFRF